MATSAQTLKKAEKFERDLRCLASEVATGLRKPASLRDPCHLEEAWAELNRQRSQARALARLLRKFRKPPRDTSNRQDYLHRRFAYEQARTFIRRLGKWDEMELMVQRHLDPTRTPLLLMPYVTRHDDFLVKLYIAFQRLANPTSQDETAEDHGCFTDIPFPILSFNLLMIAAYRVSLAQNPGRKLRFLDVGCGGGTKVFAASQFFPRADGLEYDPGYAEAARRTLQIVGSTTCGIHHGDALAFDSYAEYDVIYFYRPMTNDTRMEALEDRIISTARPGTILVAPYDTTPAPRSGMKCAQVEGPIMVTGLQQAEADQLRSDAEATGTEIVTRSSDLSFDIGYWAPILDAASFNSPG